MKLLYNMYLFMKISVGHRITFLYVVPAMFVYAFTESLSPLWWAILIFMSISLIAMLYTIFNFDRLMKEDLINSSITFK